MKIKNRGFHIIRRDMTIPQTDAEKKMEQKTGIQNFRYPRHFTCRVNNAIPPSHRMLF